MKDEYTTMIIITFDSETKPKFRKKRITTSMKKTLKELEKKNHLNRLMNKF